MRLQRALKTNTITQTFGQNLNGFYAQLGMLGHNGIDYACYYGEPIYWDCLDCEGTVLSICDDPTAGVGCDIITIDKDGIFKHTFWHFYHGGLRVRAGDVLSSGQLIGFGDSTGMSTGNHLHRMIKPQGKNSYGGFYNLYPNNGYQGAVDQSPYVDNSKFIGDTMNSMRNQISVLIFKIGQLLAKVGNK